MKFKLKRAIFWQGQLYHEGQIVEFDADPKWEVFELIEKVSKEPLLSEKNKVTNHESPDADKLDLNLTPSSKGSKNA